MFKPTACCFWKADGPSTKVDVYSTDGHLIHGVALLDKIADACRAHTNHLEGHVLSAHRTWKALELRVISCLDANWPLNRSPLNRCIPLAQQIRHAPAHEDLATLDIWKRPPPDFVKESAAAIQLQHIDSVVLC